ncbi:MAG: alanine--tRNA ligase [Candidatus Omnitrophica bacterium]|nr:alanine--tRNA ligase [Candidatus Omnitrophota bacterium]
MYSYEIRDRFLKFFEARGHKVTASDLLVPRNDPTLLFTGAGMNQFKEQFMGKNVVYKRAASCQKCLRTGDLDNVGRTPRHHTFFEMLGNFSFGDYFKKDAIMWAWEFMTREMKFAEERLWVSVYLEDSEAYDIWRNIVKVPEKRIVKLGPKDNFWPANAPKDGPNGPCGPCSEIFYDWGADKACGKPDCTPACDCNRFIEVWNLVFTQFDRQPDGSLKPLPSKNIDTGMGLERITAVVQGVQSNFGTDLFIPIIEAVKRELGESAQSIPQAGLNLIADHIRSSVFSICDGVSPSNEKQGYVIRKLIRRAYLKSKQTQPFLYGIVPVVTGLMKNTYPELEEKREYISAIVKEEEKRFSETLTTAMPILDEMLALGDKTLSGDKIFKLVDTYGMPYETVEEAVAARNVKLDRQGFDKCMEERKESSRKGSNITSDFIFKPDSFSGAPKPVFSEKLPLDVEIVFILKEEKTAHGIAEGESAEILISPQPKAFYAESGGQAGDKGFIRKGDNILEILNTCETDQRIILKTFAKKGAFALKDKATLNIDVESKKYSAMNHTATHLLQAALRKVLGGHIKQSGSMVNDSRLRFDFTHMKKLTDKEIVEVESLVNKWIALSESVAQRVTSMSEAKREGALSFFGDKYGDEVRVVSVGDISKELCGGSHVENTKEIGFLKITGETSIASGVRRIEALTGQKAEEWMRVTIKKMFDDFTVSVLRIGGAAKIISGLEGLSPALELSEAVLLDKKAVDAELARRYEEELKPIFEEAGRRISEEMKALEKNKEADAFNRLKSDLNTAISDIKLCGVVPLLALSWKNIDGGTVKKALLYLEKEVKSCVVILASDVAGKVTLQCLVTKDLVAKGINAKNIIGEIAPLISGGGGGNEFFAQAGGKDASGIAAAFAKAEEIIRRMG